MAETKDVCKTGNATEKEYVVVSPSGLAGSIGVVVPSQKKKN